MYDFDRNRMLFKLKKSDTEYSWVEEKEDFFIEEKEIVEENKDN